jgi:hypothetical protein
MTQTCAIGLQTLSPPRYAQSPATLNPRIDSEALVGQVPSGPGLLRARHASVELSQVLGKRTGDKIAGVTGPFLPLSEVLNQ